MVFLDDKELDVKERICDYTVQNDPFFVCWRISLD